MSSRFGSRAHGTDGSDFGHRERVAAHYQISVLTKSRLRFILVAHIFLWVLMVLRVSEDVGKYFQANWAAGDWLQLPAPYAWEYVWLCSILSVILAFLAMPRNREPLVRFAYYTCFWFGLLPTIWGLGTGLPKLWHYFVAVTSDDQTAPKVQLWHNFPLIVLYFIVLAIFAQVHLFSMYFMYQLRGAWAPRDKRLGNSETRGFMQNFEDDDHDDRKSRKRH